MKWLRKHKKEIIDGAQVLTIVTTVIHGFWFIYLLLWLNVGLPREWYAALITMILGYLSTGGLFYWMWRSNNG